MLDRRARLPGHAFLRRIPRQQQRGAEKRCGRPSQPSSRVAGSRARIKVVAASVHNLQNATQWGAGRPIGTGRNKSPDHRFVPRSDRSNSFIPGADGNAEWSDEETSRIKGLRDYSSRPLFLAGRPASCEPPAAIDKWPQPPGFVSTAGTEFDAARFSFSEAQKALPPGATVLHSCSAREHSVDTMRQKKVQTNLMNPSLRTPLGRILPGVESRCGRAG